MKAIRNILATGCCALLITALTITGAAADVATARFSMQDMNVSYVFAGATVEDAQAVFGVPLSSETVTLGATGETQEILHYNGLTLTFSGVHKLIAADVSDAAYTGPRGVAVGQTAQDVATKFYIDPQSDTVSVMYTAGYVEALDSQLPPCGYEQTNDDGTYALVYAAPALPWSDAVLADPTGFIYEELALFTVTFQADGIASGYSWQLGSWAE